MQLEKNFIFNCFSISFMSSSEIIIVPVGSESFILLIRLLLIVVIADILTGSVAKLNL